MYYKNLYNLGLFREKRMIFNVGGAEKGPDRAKASAEKSEKGPLKDASLMIHDIENKIKNVSDRLSKMKPKNLKGKESLIKAKFKVEKIKKRLQEIKKKIEGFMQKKEKAQQGVKVKIDTELRGMYKELTGKKWEKGIVFRPADMGKVKAPAKNPKSKPSKGNEKKETVAQGPAQKLTQLLTKLSKLGQDAMKEAGPQISKLIKQLNLNSARDAQQTHDLPGGFKIVHLEWSKDAHVRPSISIYKGNKLICFRAKNKPFQYARQLQQGEDISYTRRMAELTKSYSVLDKALSKYMTTKGLAFETGAALKDFQASLMNLAKFTHPSVKSWPYHCPTAQADVKFRRVAGGKAFFTITTPRGSMYFHTSNKNYIGLPGFAKNKKAIRYWEAKHFILPPKKLKKLQDKRAQEKVARKKAVQEKAARLKEEAAKKKMIETLQKEAKEKATMSKLINPKFKKLIKVDKDNPMKFKLDAGKSSKAKRLIRKTRIHRLLNLKSVTDKEVRVKITGPKGGVREGVYRPGDKTCYSVKSGNKTKNRLKFYDQDTFEISMKSLKKPVTKKNKKK